jgi:RNA polymerase sigma factor (sigma-70 family)
MENYRPGHPRNHCLISDLPAINKEMPEEMPVASDMDLLRDYARHNSETAFAELVQRHLAFVYSVALRQTGLAAHAEEITQAVFILLARKAAVLHPPVVLEGWLHETTRLTALSFLRRERRRQFHEQKSSMQTILNRGSDAESSAVREENWREFAPLLDDALSRLGRKDRDALILRFFRGQSLREVAAALETTEGAAQRRVLRALGKLRLFFSKRGVDSTAAAIAEQISANSIQAAPAALAKTVTAVAIAKGAAASISTLTLMKGALKIMAWTKAKTALVVGAVAVLVVGTATPIIVHHLQAKRSVFSWQRELSAAENATYVRLTGTTPAEAARTFFEACAKGDWTEASKYWPPVLLKKHPSEVDHFAGIYGGMSVVSLGKPFKGKFRDQSQVYYGVLVPYEIRMKNGEIKKWQLAMQCDNLEHHWYWDGGL